MLSSDVRTFVSTRVLPLLPVHLNRRRLAYDSSMSLTDAVVGEPVASDARYLNRELSWLDFNARVLALAEDPALPLLERAKFLAIFSQNLDEFFQVRVSALKEQIDSGLRITSPDGLDQVEQLHAIRARVDELVTRQAAVFTKEIAPALEQAGIRFSSWDDLDASDRSHLDRRVRGAHLPGAHAARRRPRAPVPLHLEPLAQPRDRRPRSRARRRPVRTGEGSAAAAALRRAPRRRTLRSARAGDRRRTSTRCSRE